MSLLDFVLAQPRCCLLRSHNVPMSQRIHPFLPLQTPGPKPPAMKRPSSSAGERCGCHHRNRDRPQVTTDPLANSGGKGAAGRFDFVARLEVAGRPHCFHLPFDPRWSPSHHVTELQNMQWRRRYVAHSSIRHHCYHHQTQGDPKLWLNHLSTKRQRQSKCHKPPRRCATKVALHGYLHQHLGRPKWQHFHPL